MYFHFWTPNPKIGVLAQETQVVTIIMSSIDTPPAQESPAGSDNDTPPEVLNTSFNDMANRAVNNPDLYIDHEDFFNLAQDIGFEMTDEEKVKARPKKLCHVAYDGRWYKDMYTLSKKIYLHYNERKEEVFTKIPTNQSNQIKKIAESILQKRLLMSRGDIYSVTDNTILPFAQATTGPQFFVVMQRDVLSLWFGKWSGMTLGELQKPTDIDRIRVLGIFFLEKNRENISRTQDRSTSNRHDLDDPSQRLSSIFQVIRNDFNDLEVIVPHPDAWTADSTMDRVDDWTSYDPNERSRIGIARDRKQIQHIFNTSLSQYREAMRKYTLGTGGGSGASSDFHRWEEREPDDFYTYPRQSAAYLTWIHMWDKQLGWILTARGDSLPDGIAIDDSTVHRHRSASSPSSTLLDSQLANALDASRTESTKTSQELLSVLRQLNEQCTTNDALNPLEELEKISNMIEFWEVKKRSYEHEEILNNDDTMVATKKSRLDAAAKTLGTLYEKLNNWSA